MFTGVFWTSICDWGCLRETMCVLKRQKNEQNLWDTEQFLRLCFDNMLFLSSVGFWGQGCIKLSGCDRAGGEGQQEWTVLPLKTFDIWVSVAEHTHTQISDHSSVAWRQWSKLLNLTAGHWSKGNTFWSKSLTHTHTHDRKRAGTAQKFVFRRTLIKREQAFTILAQIQNTQTRTRTHPYTNNTQHIQTHLKRRHFCFAARQPKDSGANRGDKIIIQSYLWMGS